MSDENPTGARARARDMKAYRTIHEERFTDMEDVQQAPQPVCVTNVACHTVGNDPCAWSSTYRTCSP